MKDINEIDLIKRLEGAKLVRMPQEDKDSVLDRLRARMDASPTKVASPFAGLLKGSYALAAACLVAIVAVGGVVSAAEGAVPGDLLYPVKVNINEPVMGALRISPRAKTEWKEKTLERRIKEAEALVSEEKLDDKTVMILEKNIGDYKASFEKVKKEKTKDQEERIEKIEKKLNEKSKKKK